MHPRLILRGVIALAVLGALVWWGEKRWRDGWAAREAELEERVKEFEEDRRALDAEQRLLTEERRRNEEARNELQRQLDAAAAADPDGNALGPDRVRRVFDSTRPRSD